MPNQHKIGSIAVPSGLLLFGLSMILAPAGFILCLIGLLKINKNPDLYRGKGFAIAGIAIAGLVLIVLLRVLAFYALIS